MLTLLEFVCGFNAAIMFVLAGLPAFPLEQPLMRVLSASSQNDGHVIDIIWRLVVFVSCSEKWH